MWHLACISHARADLEIETRADVNTFEKCRLASPQPGQSAVMSYLQLILDIGRSDPEPYELALFAIGAASVTLEDAADDPILEPAPGATPLWPTIKIKALFAEPFPPELAQALQRELGQPLPPHRLEQLADRAWEREWLKDFRPMQFGRRLWICPAGQRPEANDAIIVDLDPGLAFGTGTHATTALCLEWLDAQALQGRSVIDYGCGSGILAIAALKLGAAHADGIDIDPQALQASRDNAIRNKVSGSLNLHPDAESLKPADIVIANILAQPLLELAPRLATLVRHEGRIVLSGILCDQAPSVLHRYAEWFEMEQPSERDGWMRLTGRRHAAGGVESSSC